MLAELAPFAMGPISRVMRNAPRATTAALGLLAPTPANPQSAQRSTPASEDVKNLQRMLQSKGYYKGPIDGFTGGITEEANKRFQASEANIQRLLAARPSLDLAQTFENVGRGMALGDLGAGLHAYAKHEAPRPNVGGRRKRAWSA